MLYSLSDSFMLITSEGENHFGGMAEYHYHEQLELYFLLSGECRYFIGNKIYPVSAGQLVLIPGSMIHKTTYNTKKRDRKIISFRKGFTSLEPFADLLEITKPAIFDFSDETRDTIRQIYDKAEAEILRNDSLSPDMCKCLCFELFSVLTRDAHEISGSIQKNNEIGREWELIEKITKFITENYSDNITLSAAAESVSMSEGGLSKLFKRVTGLGFKEYLLTVRVLRAKELLKSTALSVSEIAFECGFNDSNYFSKIFGKYSDTTPLKYRKKHQKSTSD